MTSALDRPAEQSYFKVGFSYAGEFYGYTDWEEDLPGGYASTPTMEIKLPPNTGTLEDKPVEILLPLDDFTEALTSGVMFAPITVVIEEVIVSPDTAVSAVRLTHHIGRVMKATSGRRGSSTKVRLEGLLGKQRLDGVLGLPCDHQCPFRLYRAGCGVTKNFPYRANLTVTAIDGLKITVATDPAKSDRFFSLGTAELDDLVIGIRLWRSDDPLVFHMNRRPPQSWIGQIVDFYAGCDLTFETCRDKFSNEDRFGGIGYAIPAWNPNFEQPPSGSG